MPEPEDEIVEGSRLEGMSDEDWCADRGLVRIEQLAAKVPQDFTLDEQVYPKTVVATFKWDRPKDVMERGEDITRLVNAAMCIDLLCKNLRAERARRRELEDRLKETS